MLEPAEQLLLERLSLVESPVRTADVIAMSLVDHENASDALGNLTDKSLLARMRDGHETDYRMLDTVRAFATAQFALREDREVVVRAFAKHYAGIAVSGLEPTMDELAWIKSMRKCERNIERAVAWCVDHDPEFGADAIVGAYLYTHWIVGGWPNLESSARVLSARADVPVVTRLRVEANLLALNSSRAPTSEMVERARELAESQLAPSGAVINARNALTRLAHFGHDDLREAFELFAEAPFDPGSDEDQQIACHAYEGVCWLDGDLRSARSHVVNALSLEGARGYLCRLPGLLRELADLDRLLGNLTEALDSAVRGVQACDAIGATWVRSMCLDEPAVVYFASDDVSNALASAIESAFLVYNLAANHELIDPLVTVALCCCQLGAPELARQLYGVALTTMERYDLNPSFLDEKTVPLDHLLVEAGVPAPVKIDTPVPDLLAKASALLQSVEGHQRVSA